MSTAWEVDRQSDRTIGNSFIANVIKNCNIYSEKGKGKNTTLFDTISNNNTYIR
jgi:hypothetical protein